MYIAAVALIILGYLLVLSLLRDPDAGLRINAEDVLSLPLRVPRGFLWGSATSAHQVEGGCTANSWSRFESESLPDGRPRIEGSQKAGDAADQWNRWPDDIRLMQDLSLNAYRFSVEWSKIEPAEGSFDESALDHYAQLAGKLRAAGITPMVTLHHFTDPTWFADRGAFLRDDAPELFGRFVRKVVDRLGGTVTHWMTINEPTVYALNGYLFGEFPPAERNPKHAVQVLRNLLRAHTEAYRVIKAEQPESEVGLAINFFVFDPPSPLNLLDVLSARLISRSTNESLLRYLRDGDFTFGIPGIGWTSYRSGIREAFDCIGLNYYTRFHTRIHPFSRTFVQNHRNLSPDIRSDMGWEIYPEGLYRTLRVVQSFTPKPIYITENGIADDSDTKRGPYIERHLRMMNRAIAEGINVRGYFYWSLLDNFEWTFGYSRRFGLYHVDFATQRRTLRTGSRVFPDMIAQFTST